MPPDWIVLGLWLLRKPRPDGTMAGEPRFLVLTVAHVSVAVRCVKQVLRGVSHSSLPTNLEAWLFTDEETHDALKGKWGSEYVRIEICKMFSSRIHLTDDIHVVDVLSRVCLRFE